MPPESAHNGDRIPPEVRKVPCGHRPSRNNAGEIGGQGREMLSVIVAFRRGHPMLDSTGNWWHHHRGRWLNLLGSTAAGSARRLAPLTPPAHKTTHRKSLMVVGTPESGASGERDSNLT